MSSYEDIERHLQENPIVVEDRHGYNLIAIHAYNELQQALKDAREHPSEDANMCVRNMQDQKDNSVAAWIIAEEIRYALDSDIASCEAAGKAFTTYMLNYAAAKDAGVKIPFRALFETTYNVVCKDLDVDEHEKKPVDHILRDFVNDDVPKSSVANTQNTHVARLMYIHSLYCKD